MKNLGTLIRRYLHFWCENAKTIEKLDFRKLFLLRYNYVRGGSTVTALSLPRMPALEGRRGWGHGLDRAPDTTMSIKTSVSFLKGTDDLRSESE